MTLVIRLDGSNFISEKTRAAFEDALQDGHQVQLTSAPAPPAPSVVKPAPPAPAPAKLAAPDRLAAPEPARPPLDYQGVLKSLEQGLAQSFAHQNQTMHVHERYLDNQAEYSNIFFQLMQQQIALSSNGNHSPRQAETTAVVLQSLERSMMRFHDHQVETLGVHERHLRHQAEFSQSSIQILRQQYATLLNGHGPQHYAQLAPPAPAIASYTPPAMPVARPQVSAPALASLAEPLVAPPVPALSVPDAVVVGLDIKALSDKLLEVVSEKTGYPPEMLELDMDMEADLGIDSIKRVEILGVMQELYPDLPQVRPEELAELRTLGQIIQRLGASVQVTAPAPPTNGSGSHKAVAATVALDVDALSHKLLEVVSEKTGYPPEMLELDMDMEADLGIDSIKRVEILGVMQELYPDLPQVRPEELAELRTLGQIIQRLGASAAEPVKKKPERLAPAPEHNIQRSLVRLAPLPAPDFLEFSLPADHVCLIGDDGTPTSAQLAQALAGRGWQVVLLGSPLTAERPSLAGIRQVSLQDLSEERLQEQLAAIGPVGAFVHLHPRLADAQEAKAILKHVFFLAKHLQPALNAAASAGRSCFMTVTRLDGEFGLGGAEFEALSGGLFGLVKTLNLEWPQVFCRAVDLAQDLDPGQAVQHILAELHDPNRLIVEVGYGSQGRMTLTSE